MHRGYIKIWRRIQDSFLNSNSELFHLWVNLLLLASHKDTEFIFNGKKTIIKSGQFITGRQSLSLLTGIHESKIYRLLHILENEQLIEQQKTTLYTMISIVNYSQYQETEQQAEQQMNNQRTTSEQPVNTINHKETQRNTNKNKDIDDKKPPSSPPTSPPKTKYLDSVFLTQDEFLKLETQYGIEGTKMRIEELNLGIMSKGYKYKSHYHAILAWDRRKTPVRPLVNRKAGLTPEQMRIAH